MQVSEVYKNEEALTVKLGAIINDLYASGLPAPFTNKEGLALNWFRVKKKKTRSHTQFFLYINVIHNSCTSYNETPKKKNRGRLISLTNATSEIVSCTKCLFTGDSGMKVL